MTYQVKHFGTSGEIAVLIEEVNKWLKANEAFEVVAVSESQGGRLELDGNVTRILLRNAAADPSVASVA